MAKSILRSASPERLGEMRSFVGGGVGVDSNGNIIPWYHGSPYGKPLSEENAIFRGSDAGAVGPATYLLDSPWGADRYANSASRAAEEFISKAGKSVSPRRANIIRQMADTRDQLYSRLPGLVAANADGSSQHYGQYSQMIGQIKDKVAGIDSSLAGMGVELNPVVLPMVVRVTNPFDFRADMHINGMERMRIDEWLEKNGHPKLTEEAIQAGIRKSDGNPNTGEALYEAVVSNLQRSGLPSLTSARAEARSMLEALGYDGIVFPHMGTNALAVFNDASGSRVKHIDAVDFDRSSPKLYRSDEDPANVVPYKPGADLAIQGLSAPLTPEELRKIFATPMVQGLDSAGLTSGASTAVRSILSRSQPTEGVIAYLSSFSPLKFLQKNSVRARKIGANYIADFVSPEKGGGFYERHANDVGGEIMPLFNFMDGKVGISKARNWANSLKFFGDIPQPKEFANVIRALRRGDMAKLTDSEKEIYAAVRTSLDRAHSKMRDVGIAVGKVKDYVPQVWDIDKIRANSEGFQKLIADYFMKEAKVEGRPANRADAEDAARRLFDRLVDEDGVYMPPKAEKRAAASDHTDYQRMLKLNAKDKTGKLLYAAELDGLEAFMEGNLRGLLAKYHDGASRRRIFHSQYGVNNHGFHDYMHAAQYGTRGMAELLETSKIHRTDTKVPGELGVEVATVQSILMRGMSKRDAFAISEKIGALINGSKSPTEIYTKVKSLLRAARPDADDNSAYAVRSEAIARAAADFRGGKGPSANDMEFLHAFHRAAMGRQVHAGHGHQKLANFSKNLRLFNSVTLLGFTTLASIPDLGMSLVRSGSMRAWATGMANYAADKNYRAAFRDVGAAVESIVFENMANMYGGAGGRKTQAFFNAIGLQPWTKMQRQMAAAVGFEAFKAEIARMRDNYVPGQVAQNRAFRTSKRFLDHFGLTDLAMNSNQMLDISMLDPATGRSDLKAAILKFSNESIFSPNANDIPIWAQTPWGSLMFQLKSFPLMMSRFSKQVLSEAWNGNPWPLLYMATVSTGLAAGSLAIRDIVQGRGGDDPQNPEHKIKERSLSKIAENFGFDPISMPGQLDTVLGWWVESMLAMGGAGLIGDMLYQTADQLDNGAYGQARVMSLVAGPWIGTGFDAFNVAAGAAATLRDDESNATQRAGVRAAVSRVPVLGGIRPLREEVVNRIAGEAE